MSQNHHPPERKPVSFGRQRLWLSFAATGLIVASVGIWRSPAYSFHPLCTYTVNARVSAEVEIEGQKLSSTVVYQNTRSRSWISMINSAGCRQMYGSALTYRLADDSVLIVPAQICRKAEQALAKSGSVDILSVCFGKQAHQDPAFIVDSATRPTKWYAVNNGADFRINRMAAESTWSNPTDDIASIAPSLLRSDFKYTRQQWSRSPERVISFRRRQDELRKRPDRQYEFEVTNERF